VNAKGIRMIRHDSVMPQQLEALQGCVGKGQKCTVDKKCGGKEIVH
jgi:hypothetical protein